MRSEYCREVCLKFLIYCADTLARSSINEWPNKAAHRITHPLRV